MRTSMTLHEYCQSLHGQENASLDLATLMNPFGLAVPSSVSSTLLIGHIVDALHEVHSKDQAIDLMDVLQVSCELGHEPADELIEVAPFLIFSHLNALLG